MALSVETGQFAAGTAGPTTVVTLTDSGLTGKAIIFWAGLRSSNGIGGNFTQGWSVGFSDGTNHRCIAWAGDSAVATTNVGRSLRTASALDILTDGTPTSTLRITGVSFAAGSFTVTFSGTPLTAYLISFMVLGGADITNVLVGHSNAMPTSTGAWNVNNAGASVGFTADFGMFLYTKQTADGTAVLANSSIGFAQSSTKEFTMAWGVDDGQTMSANVDGVSYTNQAASIAYITDGAETVDLLADFTQFTSTGFDMNISNAQATANTLMPFLLIKGGQWDVGVSTKPTTATAQTVTGMAFQPKGALWAQTEATADATVTAGGATSSVGAAISTSTETLAGISHNDAINTNVDRDLENTKVAWDSTVAATQADFTSFQSDGWTITWGATGAALQTGWFAMTDNAAAPTTTGSGWVGAPGTTW